MQSNIGNRAINKAINDSWAAILFTLTLAIAVIAYGYLVFFTNLPTN